MYIVIAILIFGLIIATHEFGHFIAAKACKVKVLEFSIGMGPALFKRQGKETLYSLRALPIGGFCAMEGEDAESEDPRAFSGQAIWKKFIILVAGAGMNFIFGLILIIILFSQSAGFRTAEVTSFMDGCPYESQDGFQVGDVIHEINGERIYFSTNVSMIMSRNKTEEFDITLIRNGEKVYLDNYHMVPVEYQEDGETVMRYGFIFEDFATGALNKLKYSGYYALDCVRMVKISLVDLIGGSVGLKDMSGPVGIVDVINEVGESAETAAQGALSMIQLAAFIAINIGMMNLLPLPALDGGRVLFLAITWVIEKVSRRKLNPKYEGYVHAAGLVLLLGLSVLVMYNDIVRIISA